MDHDEGSGNLEMRIVALEDQIQQLRAAQEAISGGAQERQPAAAAVACGYCYCGYCYCGYCDYCYAAAAPQAAGAQAAGVQQAIRPCIVGPVICLRCYPCIFHCICGPCLIGGGGGGILGGGGGILGGGGRFGGLGG